MILEPSNRKGLFVTHSETSKAYKFYIPKEMKTVVSRDVKFKKGFASRKSHEPIPMTKDEEKEAPKVELGSLSTSKASSLHTKRRRE